MRSGNVLMILIAVGVGIAAAATLPGCERQGGSDEPPPSVPTTRRTGRAPASAPRLPTTDEVFGRLPATIDSATTQSTLSSPTTAEGSSDPLTTPQGAVTRLFALMEKEDVLGVRAMMADASLPVNKLQPEVKAVADRLRGGAKWQIIDTNTQGEASFVIFRTRFPDGHEETSPLLLINRYERWKVILGPLNMKRFTPGEKESMTKVSNWGAKRLQELRGGGPSTAPATQTTPS